MAAAEYVWDLFLPGEDLPRRLTTDYMITEGELLPVDGTSFLVERVEIPKESAPAVVPVVYVAPPHEPAL